MRWCAGGAHQDDRLAGFEVDAKTGGAAHFEGNGGHQTGITIHPCASHRQALHLHACATFDDTEGFEILQAVKLARLELARSRRCFDDHFDDGRREAIDFMHGGAPVAIEDGDDIGGCCRRALCQYTRDHRVALLGRAKRLHHVAKIGGMHIAKVGNEAAIGRF